MTGQRMAAEMAEQPRVLAALAAQRDDIAASVARVVPEPLHATVLLARGSSDHAAILGRYLLELATGRPVALAAASLTTIYDAAVDYRGVLVVAASQSGRTPEIVTVLQRLRAAGAVGIALTNDSSSPLADAADFTIVLGAGSERAVPATKTVTAQLFAFALLAKALARAGNLADVPAVAIDGLADAVAAVLGDPAPAQRVAGGLSRAASLLTTARGLLLAAAAEAALKLKEATGIHAEALSAADLRHGPIALARPGAHVLAFAGRGRAGADVAALVAELRAREARVLTVSQDDDADLPLPGDIPEPLLAIPAVVRSQQLALALARLRGIDADRPGGLQKITATT